MTILQRGNPVQKDAAYGECETEAWLLATPGSAPPSHALSCLLWWELWSSLKKKLQTWYIVTDEDSKAFAWEVRSSLISSEGRITFHSVLSRNKVETEWHWIFVALIRTSSLYKMKKRWSVLQHGTRFEERPQQRGVNQWWATAKNHMSQQLIGDSEAG